MARVTVLLAALSILIAGTAHADQLPYPTDQPVSNTRTITATSAARQLLPDGQCQPRFYIAALPPGLLGYALNAPGACTAWIPPRVAHGGPGYRGWQGRILACTVIEHEALHELGYLNATGYVWAGGRVDHTHSPDRGSIMYAFAADESVSWPCFTRFAPHGSIRVWHEDYPGLGWSTFP